LGSTVKLDQGVQLVLVFKGESSALLSQDITRS